LRRFWIDFDRATKDRQWEFEFLRERNVNAQSKGCQPLSMIPSMFRKMWGDLKASSGEPWVFPSDRNGKWPCQDSVNKNWEENSAWPLSSLPVIFFSNRENHLNVIHAAQWGRTKEILFSFQLC
jgi:hypothetical protein